MGRSQYKISFYEAYLRGQSARLDSAVTGVGTTTYKTAYEHFENARTIDSQFAAAHYQAADFWRTQLSPAWTQSGLTSLEPSQVLSAFNERIDLAIANAPTPVDKKEYRAHKALVELRLQDAMRLYREYLQDRPNDEQARHDFSVAAQLATDEETLSEIWQHWEKRGAADEEVAYSYMQGAYRFLDPSEAADYGLRALQHWPNNNGLMYQTHRTLLWAGRTTEAATLAARYSRLYPQDEALVLARQACAEGRRSEVERIYESLVPDNSYDQSLRWHIMKLLGEEQMSVEILQPYAQSGVPYMIGSWLIYRNFDPSPFPAVMAVLDREAINRPPLPELPFKCPPPEQTSIAVLPFVNMSNDAENEFFSDGIAEEILNVLASIPDLKVAARTSAFAYKGTNTNISRIAAELGVNHVLEGSVRKSGNQVRVTAQLIKADDGFHLWSANYDRELTNIFAIQDEIAASIAEALKVSLKLESGAAGNLTGTTSIDAYEHYLKGMSLWHLRTAESLTLSIDEFDKAIELDPRFAKAHAGLALAWSVIPGYVLLDGDEARDKGADAANKALSLDSNNVEALSALAHVRSYKFRYQEASELFSKAISLNPSFATAHQWYGNMLGFMGDPDAGVISLQKAWSLDPRSRIIGSNLAVTFNYLGRHDDAINQLEQVRSFAPDFPDALQILMHTEIIIGNCENTSKYGTEIAEMFNKTSNTTPVYVSLCQSEDPAMRARAIEEILSWPPLDIVDPGNPSLSYQADMIYVMIELGEFETAIILIEENMGFDGKYVFLQMRARKSENSVAFYCDPRVQPLYDKYNIPTPEGKSVCD